MLGSKGQKNSAEGVQTVPGQVAGSSGPKHFTLICLCSRFSMGLRKKSACPLWAGPQAVASRRRPVKCGAQIFSEMSCLNVCHVHTDLREKCEETTPAAPSLTTCRNTGDPHPLPGHATQSLLDCDPQPWSWEANTSILLRTVPLAGWAGRGQRRR